MTCKETIRMICQYLEGKLTQPVATAVQHHIGKCRNCRLVHETAKQTLEAYFDKDLAPNGRSHRAQAHHAKVA